MITPVTDILLQTKLYVPPTRPQLVPRSRLIEKLEQGLPRKLTLVSAPAGFGKTTLITDWLQNRPTAWLSVDREDNDPIRFWTYVAAALLRQESSLGATALSLLRHQPQIDLTQVITTLINGLLARTEPLFLVLDDYHFVDSSAIHSQMTVFLDNLPPLLHMVITSRTDLPFSIARWRVQGQVTEIRAADLRFSLAETALFLNDLMHLHLTSADVSALEARTEGWVASLQLAALSLSRQSPDERRRFVQQFTGSHRYLMDYLVDEILQHQSADRRRFLLHTSLLHRLCPQLCDAVLARVDASNAASPSQEMLDQLDAANLFLIPLAGDHTWFRYHHLFADFLQHHLRQTEPEILPGIHDRASRWFAENGFLDEAIFHALEVPDFDRATGLLAEHIETMIVHGNISQALHRINQLPAHLQESEQRLCLYHGWALMFVGQLEEAERTLSRLQTLPNPLNWPVAAYENVLKGYLIIRSDRFSDSLRQGIVLIEQAFDQLAALPNPDQTTLIIQGAAAVELAHCYAFENELDKVLALAQEAMRLNLKSGNLLAGLSATGTFARLTSARGHWQQAGVILKQGLAQAQAWTDALPWPRAGLPAAASLMLDLGLLYCQWNELDKAAPLIEEADVLYALTGAVDRAEGLVGLAYLRWTQGDGEAVEDILKTLRQLAQDSPNEHVRHRLDAAVAEWQIRLVQMGHEWAYLRPEIQRWAKTCGLQDHDPLNFRTEPRYVTLVQAWCLMDQAEAALALLHRLQLFAAQTERFGDVWRYEVLEAVVQFSLGETVIARRLLQESLAHTEPEGIIRLYVDEGQPIATLLQQLPPTPYRDRLLAAFHIGTPQIPPYDPQSQLVERLSDRELEVLHLLASGATNQQIADDLIISHATAKKHVSNITGKLGVQNRASAVAHARKLGLIE